MLRKNLLPALLTVTLMLSGFIPAACQAATPVPELPSPTPTTAPTRVPTNTAVPTATAIRTPPVLPGGFTSVLLNPLDTPHTYIQEPCTALRDKWSSTNSPPGTVVMVIMVHSIISEGQTNANQISKGDFRILMEDLHEQNFQAIDAQQLADFLDHNAMIPSRSVLLLVDDRHYAQYFNEFFREYWEKWDWPVVNAFISFPENTQSLWDENAALEAEGFVDHQAHGVIHNHPIDLYSTDDYILGELNGSISSFQQYFDKTPIAFIWPGGGFTPHAAGMARQSGYQLGFTVNPRGPLMYNWIPLADKADPMRPSYMPEGEVNDPLMVLPRYWVTDADLHIDTVRQVGKEAAAHAELNKAVELEYYDIVCSPTYGPMP